ncbi:hypothetical protein VNO80_11314 [Phaseolus coccineus]|uniref:Anther-specific protein BCP1 n=1 Tax=Phaseolus coccineus TaxID=3886 RepID=A0AAN9NG81_PHACN
MARARRVVVLALLMFAVVGLASAAEKTAAPADSNAADYDDDDYSIGAIGSGAAANGVVAAPLGGPLPPGAFANAKGGDTAPSTAAAYPIYFSAIAGVASAAVAAAFYL